MDLLAKEILKDVNLDEISAKASKPKNPVDHWSPPVLLERAAYLRKLAKHGPDVIHTQRAVGYSLRLPDLEGQADPDDA